MPYVTQDKRFGLREPIDGMRQCHTCGRDFKVKVPENFHCFRCHFIDSLKVLGVMMAVITASCAIWALIFYVLD